MYSQEVCVKRISLASVMLVVLLLTPSVSAPQFAVGQRTASIIYLPLLTHPARRLVFVHQDSDIQGELFTIRSDGAEKTRLTSTVAREWSPAPSPNGTRIAFTREQVLVALDGDFNYRYHVYVMAADGTGERKLVDMLSSTMPAWSPDGARIAFLGYTVTGEGNEVVDPELYIVGADGGGLQQLTQRSPCEGAPQWSPNGRMIACGTTTYGGRFLVMNADGSQQRLLNPNEAQSNSSFIWSPDSTRIVYVSGTYPGSSAIKVLPVDGSPSVTLLTSTNQGDRREIYAAPRWSPDGQRIIFVTMVLTGATMARMIEVINTDGSGRTRLIERDMVTIGYPAWSPDGSLIVFWYYDQQVDRFPGIYVMDPDGSNLRRLAEGFHAAWIP